MLKRKRNQINPIKLKRGMFGSTSMIMGEIYGGESVPSQSNAVGITKTETKSKIAELVAKKKETQTIKKVEEPERVKKAKKVIYTCITGGYDTLFTPKEKYDNYDYICFTDDKNMKSDVWQFREIPEELLGLDKTRQQRSIKICPHKYLSDYDMSIWVDGNIKLNFDFRDFVNSFIDEKHSVFVKKHPIRDCIYKEKDICIKLKKDDKELMEKQIQVYKNENFPSNFGLSETNVIVRFHNEKDSIILMDSWISEVLKWSKRDQLSFNYCVWKTNTDIKYFNNQSFLKPTTHLKKKMKR